MSEYSDLAARVSVLEKLAGITPPSSVVVFTDGLSEPDENGGVLTEVTEAIRAEHAADLARLDADPRTTSPNGSPWPGNRIYTPRTLEVFPNLTERQRRNILYNSGYTGAPYVAWDAWTAENVGGDYSTIPGAFNAKNWATLEAEYREAVRNRLTDLRLLPK